MANTYKALQTVTVGAGGAASVSFTNIPATYTDLVIKASTRDARTGISVSDIRFNFNGSGVGTSISGRYMYGTGSAVTSTTISSSGELAFGDADGATANTFGNAEIYIPNYVSSNFKSIYSDSVAENNATQGFQLLLAGLWSNTAPITSIAMTPFTSPFAQYTTFTLYGVFNKDVSAAPIVPTIGTASDGGTGTTASVAFTGVSGAASYTATSTPGTISATGTKSPITVSGLTTGTAYTFKVKASNPLGTSAESAASNSVTPSLASGYYSIASADASGTSSITFSSIPSNFRQLQIRFSAMSALNTTGWDNIYMRINTDSGSNYGMNFIYADSSTLSTGTSIPNTYILVGDAYRNSNTENSYGVGIVDIIDYASTTKIKTVSAVAGQPTSVTAWEALQINGWWNNTAAITSITLFSNTGSNFKARSFFSLYGIV